VYATREEETHGMIELACRLKRICSKYTCQDGAPLWLDVGMDSGNVTGKIVGKTKSFWCLSIYMCVYTCLGRPITYYHYLCVCVCVCVCV
jgi:hypothetical protein